MIGEEHLSVGDKKTEVREQKTEGRRLEAKECTASFFVIVRSACLPSSDEMKDCLMPAKRPLAYSTDPDPEPAPKTEAAPPNLAAPFPTRQRNQPVRVYLERKGRGGKTVSVIKGVMSPPHGKEALVKLLKTKLGTGGSVKDEDLEIQGDQRDNIVVLLNELGYSAKRAGG